MSQAKCSNCGESFEYDEEVGLNMQRFEPESNARYIFIGGVFPACPKCGTRYHPPPRYTTEVKYTKVAFTLRLPKALTEGD